MRIYFLLLFHKSEKWVYLSYILIDIYMYIIFFTFSDLIHSECVYIYILDDFLS